MSGSGAVWIASAVRTPIGKFLGGLAGVPATRLGALAVAEAIRRAGAPPDAVDEVILGNVLSAGLGQNPARQAALGAGLPPAVAAFTVNKVCGSGLKAVMLARQAILAGDAEVVVAGGMESMSGAPHLIPGLRFGSKWGDVALVDSAVHDGLTDAGSGVHMGETAELVADRYRISREEMDEAALTSHRRAAAASNEGRFADELLPVAEVGRDEPIRDDASAESLARLRPAFRPDGRVTAGNAPGLSDGAAAVVVASERAVREHRLPRLARIHAQSISGLEPKWVMMTPVPAVHKLLGRLDWTVNAVQRWEINEAFAVQAVAVGRELELPPERTNPSGGAVALGHPIGASGARVLTTLLHGLEPGGRGVAALCLGGGNGVAMGVERG